MHGLWSRSRDFLLNLSCSLFYNAFSPFDLDFLRLQPYGKPKQLLLTAVHEPGIYAMMEEGCKLHPRTFRSSSISSLSLSLTLDDQERIYEP
jgi:hypothetical protein